MRTETQATQNAPPGFGGRGPGGGSASFLLGPGLVGVGVVKLEVKVVELAVELGEHLVGHSIGSLIVEVPLDEGHTELGVLEVGALLLMNEWVWQGVTHAQGLASAWPVCGVLAAGLAGGRRIGIAAGASLGLVGYAGILIANDGRLDWSLARVSTGALLALSGWAAGYLTNKLRQSESLIATAQAREEVTRTLHDGVLQTLAVIQRRSDDADLAALARDQERDLRAFLTGATAEPKTLAARLLSLATSHERHHGVAVQLIVADDLDEPSDVVVEAIAGAVTESLNNVAKHAQAQSVTVYVEPTDDDGVFCSVKDDGVGFDTETTETRIGIERSIRGRMSDIGGRVEIRSRPGRGTEVQVFTSS